MTYTFLATYIQLPDQDYTMRRAEDLVLEEWRVALEHKKVPPISNAKLSFKTYDISKYPYQELLKNYISQHYRNCFGDLCFCGEFYEDEEALISALDTQHKLIVLTVEETD